MRPMPVTTNQRGRLFWKIAEAGIPRENLLAATEHNPILLHGSTIDVMQDGRGVLVHFCLSSWIADDFCRERAEHYEGLRSFIIEFLCPMPERGYRYGVDAKLFYRQRHPVLAVTRFTNPIIIPPETIFCPNDLHQANRTTEHSTRRRPLPSAPRFSRRRQCAMV